MNTSNTPETWTEVKLREVARVVYGKALHTSRREPGGDIPVYGSSGEVGHHDKSLHPGPSIVIGRKGTVGSVYYIAAPFWCIDTAFYLDGIRQDVDIEYLAYALRKQNLVRLSLFAAVPGLGRADLESVIIPLPPLPEQRRIVAILRQAEEIRRKRREAEDIAAKFLPSMFHGMFGSPIQNEMEWPTKPLDGMGTVMTGNTPPRQQEEYYGDDVEWIKSDNLDTRIDYVTQSKEGLSLLGAERARIAEAGSTLITCIAGSPDSIGKAALTDRDVAFNQQINAITPNFDVPSVYLYGAIKALKPAIQALSSGGMKGIVNKSSLEQLLTIDPPPRLRKEFTRRAEAAILLKASVVEAADKADMLVISLMAKAFTGELTAAWREMHREELAETPETVMVPEALETRLAQGIATSADLEEAQRRIENSIREVLGPLGVMLINAPNDIGGLDTAPMVRFAQFIQLVKPYENALIEAGIIRILSETTAAVLPPELRDFTLNPADNLFLGLMWDQLNEIFANGDLALTDAILALQEVSDELKTIEFTRHVRVLDPDDPRFHLLRELSEAQKTVYWEVRNAPGYVTPAMLHETKDINLAVARRGLLLLARTGLIQAISLPNSDGASQSMPSFVDAYRKLRPEDDDGKADFDPAVTTAPSQPGKSLAETKADVLGFNRTSNDTPHLT